MEARESVRASARARLLDWHAGLEGATLTQDLLRQGPPLLLDATFEDEDLSVHFDALLRVGDCHYVPVLFHGAEKPLPMLRMLLGVYAVILADVQGKEPAFGVLFYGRGCEQKKFRLAGVFAQGSRFQREARESRTGPSPRLLLNDHCQVCEYRMRCQAEAAAKDDLSLLRGMAEAEVQKYAHRGIFTFTQLSCTFRPPRRMKKPEDRTVTHSHALQALAVREKKVHVLGSPQLPVSPSRISLDLEGDPERGFCYLAGMVVREGDAEDRHSFWIDSPAEEPALLDRLLAVAGRHPDAWLYAYGSYEAAFLRRVGKAAGREQEVAAVLARLCNVLSIVHPHVYFPVHCHSLKDVAGHLGFHWTDPNASGVLSVVWRRRWEETGSPAWKEKLTSYNLEDCEALRLVAEFLHAACPVPGAPEQPPLPGHEVTKVAEMEFVSTRREWCRMDFAVDDFKFINERAYFDYQRDRVYVRTSKTLKKSKLRNRGRKGKRDLPANRHVELRTEKCPFCGCEELTRVQHGRLARFAFDLRITRGGVRRWVTRFTTTYHLCAACGKRFLPWEHLRLDPHCHRLQSWAMNQHVVRRISLANVAEMIQESFSLPVFPEDIRNFKRLMARRYEPTYKHLLEKLIAGNLIHADETEVHLKGRGKGYVWVFTNLEEVVFMYRPTLEGDFLHELLKGFRGVLVSDFYAAYDSLPCPQQKCLIHLIRDFNDDIHRHPWDEGLKGLASSFGTLVRAVVATIDEHGLRRRQLCKHRQSVDRFFESIAKSEPGSDLAESYRKRLLKCQAKLFTFLEHDGVPWNNNNAEHAIKMFAYSREQTDRMVTEGGLKDYLVLLSLRLTCKYKGVSFLKFLISREINIDTFCQSPGKMRPVPTFELQPEWWTNPRRKREQSWDEDVPGKQDNRRRREAPVPRPPRIASCSHRSRCPKSVEAVP
jgi:predicted RecB family nuclease